MELEFEWHELKAEANRQAHGVSFELAKTVFKDPFAIELLDDRSDYGEDRMIMIGMAEGQVLLFVSARRATKLEQNYYFTENAEAAKRRCDRKSGTR
jgi:uncharacterized protein